MDPADKSTARVIVGSGETAQEYVYTERAEWCAVNASGDVVPLTRTPIASLPLLEKPVLELWEELTSASNTGEAIAFPFLLVVEAAIRQGHEYWVSRALKWVTDAKQASLPWAELAIERFDDVAKSKKYSQEFRHAVQRARASMRRA